MAKTFKKLHFHQLSVLKRTLVKKAGTASEQQFDDLEIKQVNNLFEEIINNKLNNNCIRIQQEYDPDYTTLEVIEHNDEYIFGRLGKEKDVRAFHIREGKTLISKPIDVKKDQIFEVFTYLLIDRETLIVSYLFEQSAPSILKLGELFTNLYKDDSLFGEIAAVSVEDAIPFLSQKDSIGTITYKTTLPPSDSRLWNEEVTGLDRSTYESIENLKNVEITVKLVAERNKDTFPDKGMFSQAIRKITEFGSKIKVRAKNDDEYTQEHSLINNPLTKKVNFEFNEDIQDMKLIKQDIYEKMVKVYNKNKSEVLRFCKQKY
ncbi:hypothetical protein [Oceanobacillus chungangensis]|uniref:DUF4747 domain-containing protein n=1 Tax=Oceanobacillus chungangensis TaxID=1229152 RepID=A0A3D8PL41_9BACI|nr:hypothetical protein [Oceanobacillus chungangensis]RDW15948.1 hypothetical protein CWR45_15750 [Oceanobacillus chungangensis]